MMRTFTLAQLSQLTGARLVGDSNHSISGVESLESATPDDASFLDNPRYAKKMRSSAAGVIFVHPSTELTEGRHYLLSDTPSLDFQKVVEVLIPPAESGFSGVHPTAVIHPSAKLGEDVVVAPYAVIDRDVVVGAGTRIGVGVSIGPEVQIGERCLIHPHVTIRERCQLGSRVIVQPGAVIGACGYGYHTDVSTGKHTHLAHRGRVVIEDDVEIGAGTTIDRARFEETRVARGTKIDNLVQIAHQVKVGPDNLIISQSGIAGSSKTGRNVILAGQVGVVGHVELGDGVILAARAAAIKSIDEPGYYTGVPASPVREYNELMVHFRNLKKMASKLKALEKQVEELSASSKTKIT